MRIKSILILISLLLISCGTKEEIQYYRNGAVKSKIKLKNGKRHGMSYWYYSDGSLEIKSSYKDGLQDGFTTIYHQNGKIKEKTYWMKDKADGWSEEYYANGQLKKKALKRDGHNVGTLTIFSAEGKPVETQIYNPKGRLVYVRQYAEEDRGTEVYIAIFENSKDIVFDGGKFRKLSALPTP